MIRFCALFPISALFRMSALLQVCSVIINKSALVVLYYLCPKRFILTCIIIINASQFSPGQVQESSVTASKTISCTRKTETKIVRHGTRTYNKFYLCSILQKPSSKLKVIDNKWTVKSEVTDRSVLSDEMANLCSQYPIYYAEKMADSPTTKRIQTGGERHFMTFQFLKRP